MLLEVCDKLGAPQRLECKRLLVRDSAHGNPICVVLEHAPDRLWVKHSGDPDFHTALAVLGITDAVVVQNMETQGPAGLLLPDSTR